MSATDDKSFQNSPTAAAMEAMKQEWVQKYGGAHPNLETIQGLREVANWLEQHPELPTAYYAAVTLRSGYQQRDGAREALTALAEALGDRAQEKGGPGLGEVSIEAKFGPVRVSAAARIQDLRDHAPIEPEYEPIIARTEATT